MKNGELESFSYGHVSWVQCLITLSTLHVDCELHNCEFKFNWKTLRKLRVKAPRPGQVCGLRAKECRRGDVNNLKAPHTLGQFMFSSKYWFRLSIHDVLQCSTVMPISFDPSIKSKFYFLLISCIVVNLGPSKSLLPLASTQCVASRVWVGDSKLTKGGLTSSIIVKNPPGVGSSGRKGCDRKNQGGKGNEIGSMSRNPPRQCGRK